MGRPGRVEEKRLPVDSWEDREDKIVVGKRTSENLYREGNVKIQEFPVFVTLLGVKRS